MQIDKLDRITLTFERFILCWYWNLPPLHREHSHVLKLVVVPSQALASDAVFADGDTKRLMYSNFSEVKVT
jgi:hypothetical protein